jgi:hypothetical protein
MACGKAGLRWPGIPDLRTGDSGQKGPFSSGASSISRNRSPGKCLRKSTSRNWPITRSSTSGRPSTSFESFRYSASRRSSTIMIRQESLSNGLSMDAVNGDWTLRMGGAPRGFVMAAFRLEDAINGSILQTDRGRFVRLRRRLTQSSKPPPTALRRVARPDQLAQPLGVCPLPHRRVSRRQPLLPRPSSR